MPEVAHAHIYHYFPHPETGEVLLDDEGDPMLGHYFQLVDAVDEPVSHLIGPYSSPEQAEAACKHAWRIGDY